MAFLAKIGTWLVQTVLAWTVQAIAGAIRRWREKRANEKENARLRKQLEDAQTPEDREKAAQDIADRFSR